MRIIEEGKFYFIQDKFFDLFSEYHLMTNKENGYKRPCYFCFKDYTYKDIIWFVPISSKVEKYKKIYEDKIKSRKTVYNFVFGKVLGKEKTFLIQNIFPTIDKFIEGKYATLTEDVNITKKLQDEIINTSISVIKLAENGHNIPFYDIIKMRNTLLEYINKQEGKFGLKENELNEIINIISKYPQVEKATLYGSRARGDYNDRSDIDIALFGDEITNNINTKIYFELEDIFTPYSFDLINFNSLDATDNIFKDIKRDGVNIYIRHN